MSGIQLFADSNRGIYIPSHFALNVAFDKVVNIEEWQGDLNYLSQEKNMEDNNYWDTWQDVLDNIELKDSAGNVWTLYQDGDLWLVCEALMTSEERSNFFCEEF